MEDIDEILEEQGLSKENLEAAFPFGYGLSYTQFEYGPVSLQSDQVSENDTLRATVRIKNIGEMDGAEIAQLYIGYANSQVDRPVKVLRDFKKVEIASGSYADVEFNVATEDIKWYNPVTEKWELELMEYEVYVGSSSSMNDLQVTQFKVSER